MRATLVPLLLLAPLAGATHTPTGPCEGEEAFGIVEVTSGLEGATFYVDDRGYLLENGLWVYQETNGFWSGRLGPGLYADEAAAHNLQRGGASWLVPDDADACRDGYPFPWTLPDALVL